MPERRKNASMEDSEIIRRLWDRNENALTELRQKYGAYCLHVSDAVLHNRQDAEEIVNDVCLAAWNTIPPQKPASLSAYLGKLARRRSVSRLRETTAQKRGGGEYALSLEELEECIPDTASEGTADAQELTNALNEFLATLPDTERRVFVCRYWYALPVCDIAARFGSGESRIKMMLKRTRDKLRAYLQKEGIEV